MSGVSSAGLSTTVLPAASAGAELPGGDRQREVPGRDQADHAERLAEGEVDAAGDRDRVAEQPLGRARVVAEDVGDHADLAAGVGDRLADVARLERGQVLGAARDRAATGASAGASRRRDRPPGRGTPPRPGDARVGLLRAGPRAPRASTSSVAGSMRITVDAHSRLARVTSSRTCVSDSAALRARIHQRPDHAAALVLLGVPQHAQGVSACRAARSPRRCRRRPTSRRRPAPSPSSSTPWWWWTSTAVRSRADRARGERARLEAALVVAEGAGHVAVASSERSGRCWSSVPPQATLSSCMPRQMPSTGMSRSSAACASASSKRSRSGQVPRVSGAAARRSWRVDVGRRRRGSARRAGRAARPAPRRAASSGGSTAPAPPAALHRQRVSARRAGCTTTSQAPQAARSTAAQMPMTGRLIGLTVARSPRNFSQSVTAASNASSSTPRPVQVVVDDLLRRTPRARCRDSANRSRAAYIVCGTLGLSDS